MADCERTVEVSAEKQLDSLIGEIVEQSVPAQLPDLNSLRDDERDAEIASKEKVIRFYERILSQELKQRREEHELRKRFMPRVFWLVVGVLASTVGLLIAAGCVNACGGRFLSDKVLITLLTATVADIIGILIIAMRWLYPKHPSAP